MFKHVYNEHLIEHQPFTWKLQIKEKHFSGLATDPKLSSFLLIFFCTWIWTYMLEITELLLGTGTSDTGLFNARLPCWHSQQEFCFKRPNALWASRAKLKQDGLDCFKGIPHLLWIINVHSIQKSKEVCKSSTQVWYVMQHNGSFQHDGHVHQIGWCGSSIFITFKDGKDGNRHTPEHLFLVVGVLRKRNRCIIKYMGKLHEEIHTNFNLRFMPLTSVINLVEVLKRNVNCHSTAESSFCGVTSCVQTKSTAEELLKINQYNDRRGV